MSALTFSYNWNKKLENHAFTTVRLWNPDKYFQGAVLKVVLNNSSGEIAREYGEAAIVSVKKITLDRVNEFIAFLDSGYDVEEFKKIITTMYKGKKIDWKNQDLALVLLVKLKTQSIQRSIF